MRTTIGAIATALGITALAFIGPSEPEYYRVTDLESHVAMCEATATAEDMAGCLESAVETWSN